ncbi:hypothetical protein [Oscillibacter sp.]|uniref:hypothetical protein n=1 Tax=Oscillibacter sp. TaxID=1945593 RepID=UPI001B5980DC|nr:hypothetical protein [Oscillibacter sp.]MBP3509416.1 hypothetical protein [Oscillibacter sp.]
MDIQGYFTKKGLALSAKLATGALLTITRVAAGAGQTADHMAATSLPQPKQTLAVNSPARSWNTATIPVTLAAAQAAEDYTLTELGVYAQDPDEGEILYKLYRLDTPVNITAGSRMVLRFYLEETVSQDVNVTVSCSPAGLVTEEDFLPVRETLQTSLLPPESVTLAAGQLPAYVAALPRFLAKDLTITVSGPLTEPLVIQNFHGNGSLRIVADSMGAFTVRNTRVSILNCDIRVELYQLAFATDSTVETAGTVNLLADRSPLVWVMGCAFSGNGAGQAIMSANRAAVSLENLTVKSYETAVSVWNGGTALLTTVSGESNTYGICAYNGGIAYLTNTELLVGGTSNYNSSGFIVRCGSMV